MKNKILGLFLCLFASSVVFASDIDKRRVLKLTEMQREHVLSEMRALLSGTQNILVALQRKI
jgi:hypothetical protein